MPTAEAVPRGGLRGLRAAGRALLGLPPFVFFLGAGAWMGFIWRLSSQSIVSWPVGYWYRVVPNCAHAPLFGLLALALAAGVVPRGAPSLGRALPGLAGWRVAVVLGTTLAYAFVDEWHQSLVPGREVSLGDVLTDGVGALGVVWIVQYLGRPDATEPGLWRRLLAGVLLCFAAACIASIH